VLRHLGPQQGLERPVEGIGVGAGGVGAAIM